MSKPGLCALSAVILLGGCASGALSDVNLFDTDQPIQAACVARTFPELGGPAPPSGFGCANQAALAAMVADPRDLDQGRPATPADGEAVTDPVRRLRTGQAKVLSAGTTAAPILASKGDGE